ncbi:MAG: M20 family metallopeptidase [Bacteroidia bacterium]
MNATLTALADAIRERAQQLHTDVVMWRRHIHAHPELSFEEHDTAAFIEQQLNRMNIPHKRIAGTGIAAMIQGKNPSSKNIALRGDMDALPIHELNDVSYKSVNNGIMHACGHDVHSASLLGAAAILQGLRDQFEGSIKLIFQPGEEKLPGGASLMIKEGVLENPSPATVFAQHVFPSLPAGKVGFRSGMYMASTDELYMTVKGKPGHAAMPKDYNNPLLIASAILLRLNETFMKEDTRLPQTHETPTVLAFGRIEGLGATNVIPAEVKIEGTFRTMNEIWRAEAHRIMKTLAEQTAHEMGGICEFVIENGYPFLVNDPAVTERARAAAEIYLGRENVTELELRMTAEDFAFFSQNAPVCFYRLGTASPDGKYTAGVHTPVFDIDENALKTGSGLLAFIALNELMS